MKGLHTWNEYINLLKEYKLVHGNINIPQNYIVDGIKLGVWLTNQKQLYKSGKLSVDQINELNELNIIWDLYEYLWNEKYELLKKYKEEFGNVSVPYDYEVDGIKLGVWLREQKRAYKGLGTCKINEKQINKLTNLGINFDNYEESWNRKYELLKKYYNEHGNVDVPLKYVVGEVNLGKWLVTQRMAYKRLDAHKITKERIAMLNELGIKWDVINESWDKKYELLKKYKEKFGNVDVPATYELDGIKLGYWLNTQRRAYKGFDAHKITKEQIAKLNELGIKWDVINESWEEKYKLLKKYKKEFGNINVPAKYEIDGINLGKWLVTQRMAYKGLYSYKITKEQIAKLNKLGMKWELDEAIWNEKYALVKKYYDIHGNINIPSYYKPNAIPLKTWLNTQKMMYKNGTLDFRYIKLLNQLGIDWSIKDTKVLNSDITNMEIYNITLLKRTTCVLNDLLIEGINGIYSPNEKKRIEKILIKRIWR